MNYTQLTQTLAESFSALADEVQALIDRKTILEHKLRFAHEQYQYLADKYAPAVPEISETLAKLQIPPEIQSPLLVTATSAVPLPRRAQPSSPQHQIALLIREGRRAAQQLAAGVWDASKGSAGSSKETSLSPRDETMTSMSTVLEQDFTVEGRKGILACPFSASPDEPPAEPLHDGAEKQLADDSQDLTGTTVDPTPHKSSDPICAAMLGDNMSAPVATAAAAAAAASKCPIRFLDKHSPEEIAHYVETHKHEIPRSHEVCVSRYQKNEEQIRKLDAKYGNLVSMINDLSHLHQPMLPSARGGDELEEVDKASNKRVVENWAQTVTASDPEQENEAPPSVDDDDERLSHFDRPLRDVRVGESPSRPWGISVPLTAGFRPEDLQHRPESPPPAPVMHSPLRAPPPHPHHDAAATGVRKCPFDFSKPGFPSPFPNPHEEDAQATSSHHRGIVAEPALAPEAEQQQSFTAPVKQRTVRARAASPPPVRPTFVNLLSPEMPAVPPKASAAAADTGGGGIGIGGHPTSQMVFNISGPVFIGYPMEQAIQFMQRFQGGQ
ncbi:hypothetical protein B0H63DRAFT_517805 [Podospora didyma]|uniref:Uncharacterized protein n=1 Tax=Podospora didyma TaxID=330526 RepID=A0AAE0U8A2_9PEZI|nr:hypothetical protein B0H63DRAFT_517805 [Podospora didyma]